MIRFLGAAIAMIIAISPAVAAPPDDIAMHPGIVLVTGDTWIDSAARYRLYGVQACLRGTYVTNASGRKMDCGEASIAFLAAFVSDTGPRCRTVATVPGLAYVMCSAAIGDQDVDLGTALIGRGYAFASLDMKGMPIHRAYAVAEERARRTLSGLWQFSDIPHPSLILGKAATGTQGPRP